MFVNRMDGALQLAKKLSKYKDKNALVLGISRGGVETAYYLASFLEAEMSMAMIRELRYPINKQYAFGAIAEDGTVYYNPGPRKRISQETLDETEDREQAEIRRLIKVFRKGCPLPDLRARLVIIADDGIAGGATALCAARMCKIQGARTVIVASPISSADTKKLLEAEADEVVILETPAALDAVSQAYESFPDMNDHEILALIKRRETEQKKIEP